MHCIRALFLLYLLRGVSAKVPRDNDDISLPSDQAKRFFRSKRGLYHECYEESCDFEEVEEVLGRTERAYEYYYTYTCRKFGKNCEVKCNHRKDCSFSSWGSWTGHGNTGCFTQTRYKPYNHPIQTTYQRHNCNGLHTSCPNTPSESRNYCVCKKAVCSLSTWSSWSGSIPQGECGVQQRTQPYSVSWTTEVKIGSCSGVNTKCNQHEVDVRKRCSCKQSVCNLKPWSAWSGSVRQGECGVQTRARSYDKTYNYEERSHCEGVTQGCPAPITDERDLCSCKYTTCELGPWSDWEPKVLKNHECGQTQHRVQKYQKSLAYETYEGRCPLLPQKCPDDVRETRQQCKCAYRDSCELKEWTKWSEDVTEVGCQIQTRTREYVAPLKHAQADHCKGFNTKCIEEPKETRNFCKCKYVKCELGNWSKWSGLDIGASSCGEQTRIQSYNAQELVKDKVDNCNGVPTVCPAEKNETRTMCKCKTVGCEVGDWGEWKGAIPVDTCSFQVRKKSVETTEQLKDQEKTCDGLPTTCTAPPTESRKMCNCSYRDDCILKEWGAWSGEVPEDGCAVQIRTRTYNKSIIYVALESCTGLDICPEIRDETRTNCNCNEVVCKWTDWFRTSFDPKTKCYEEMRVQNRSSGFNKLQKFGSCDGVRTSCSGHKVERRKECVSGGGGSSIITSPPLTTHLKTTPSTIEIKPATFVSIGCFADSGKEPRPLPLHYVSMRSKIDWYNMWKTVQQCADEAKKRRFEYFGVQFYGECWGGRFAGKTYSREGPSTHCWNGVGQERANAVYRLEEMPACSAEIEFSAKVRSGFLHGDAWCAGNLNKNWMVVDLKNPKKITGVATQGGTKDSWITTYSLEFSEEGESWLPYKEDGNTKIFAGNSDRFTLETRWLKFPINARFLRLNPQSWSSIHHCMKIRVYGCDAIQP